MKPGLEKYLNSQSKNSRTKTKKGMSSGKVLGATALGATALGATALYYALKNKSKTSPIISKTVSSPSIQNPPIISKNISSSSTQTPPIISKTVSSPSINSNLKEFLEKELSQTKEKLQSCDDAVITYKQNEVFYKRMMGEFQNKYEKLKKDYEDIKNL